MANQFILDEAQVRELFDSPKGDVAKLLTRTTRKVERGAKRRCPVDTGRLRASITQALAVDFRGLHGVVGTDVEYAPYVELGTSTAPAQPFLRPALAEEVGLA